EEQIPPSWKGEVTPTDKMDFVSRWVDNEVLYQEAKRRRLNHHTEVKSAIKAFRRRLMTNRLLEEELGEPPSVGEEEVRAYYAAHQGEFVWNDTVLKLVKVSFQNRSEARSVRSRVKMGQSLADQARVLGFFDVMETGYQGRDQLGESLWISLGSLSIGGISTIIGKGSDAALLQVVDRKEKGSVKDISIVRDDIYEILKAEKQRLSYKALVERFRSEADVEVFPGVLEEQDEETKGKTED
ncbi:peptidyl-prolyl cis-trans isomerase, partial [candidate division KSB1 bacterium]|nr:peptidyl-prolyl cis-trans isomerase [candidate division KSB1 bacterium]